MRGMVRGIGTNTVIVVVMAKSFENDRRVKRIAERESRRSPIKR